MLGNTAWAFATVCRLDGPLFTALARVAAQRMGDFNAQDLANTAWAWAQADQFGAQIIHGPLLSFPKNICSYSGTSKTDLVYIAVLSFLL